MAKDSKTKAGVKDDRTRTWAFVAYPESLPPNWRAVLDEMSVPWACSPLHDKDVNETTGEPKKPHYHVVLSFEGKKSYEQVKEFTDKLKATVPQKCHSVRGAVRYMAHLDNPEKAQYSTSDITCGMGFDVDDALKLSATEKDQILQRLEDFIFERHVREYAHLAYWVSKYHPEWRETLKCNSYHIGQIIKSIRNSGEENPLIDLETGEVV